MNYERKSRRRLFLLMRSRTPPISSEFRGGGGLNTPNPPSRYATDAKYNTGFSTVLKEGCSKNSLFLQRGLLICWETKHLTNLSTHCRTTRNLLVWPCTRMQLIHFNHPYNLPWKSDRKVNKSTICIVAPYFMNKYFTDVSWRPSSDNCS